MIHPDPAAVVMRDVAPGRVRDPGPAEVVAPGPVAVAVGAPTDGDHRTPVPARVDVDPLAVALQIMEAFVAAGAGDLLGRAVAADLRFALAAPRVEVVTLVRIPAGAPHVAAGAGQ